MYHGVKGPRPAPVLGIGRICHEESYRCGTGCTGLRDLAQANKRDPANGQHGYADRSHDVREAVESEQRSFGVFGGVGQIVPATR